MASFYLPDKEVVSARTAEIPSRDGAAIFDENISHVPEKFRGTSADEHDMLTLGKKQVLRRNFSFITMLGFASTCICSWEGVLSYLYFALIDGGTGMLFWGFVAAAMGQSLVYASIAEMASMSPTAGGQYHWVSEFAPRRYQKILSYISGWLTAIGWQVFNASVCFLTGTIIQGLIVLNDPTYVYQRWHGTLLSMAAVVFSISFNTALAGKLPIIEVVVLVLHVSGLLAVVITLWVMAPRAPAEVALLTFTNNGGWSSVGLSSMIGILSPVTVIIGYDCSVHMGEEIKDASITLPRAIMGSVIINTTLSMIMIITICFTVGDINEVLVSPTGYPFIQVIYNATQSLTGTTILVSVIAIMFAFCAMTEAAAASRQIWSFALDAGLPGHTWLRRVSPGWNIPLPAVSVTLLIAALLSLINIGSTVALNAITSLGAVAILISYFLTISCLVYRRLTGPPLPARRWSLGRYGLAINIAALVFLTPVIFFVTWPLATPVTATGMNWSSVMLVGVLAIAMLYYIVKARKEYVGPVVHVKREE